MPLRRPSQKERRRFDLREFGWTAAQIAVLRHSSLPFGEAPDGSCEIDGVDLETAKAWGRRDRLALLAQFAAHVAFLRRVGVAAGPLRTDEWLAVRNRGEDPRLVRVRATPAQESFTAALESIGAFANLLNLRLSELEASWTRAEQIWAAALKEMCSKAGECHWTRRAQLGWIESPGSTWLEELAGNPSNIHSLTLEAIGSLTTFRTLQHRPTALMLGSEASPIESWSAFRKVLPSSHSKAATPSEGEMAELLLNRINREGIDLVITRNVSMLDERSIRAIRIACGSAVSVCWVFESSSANQISVTNPRIAPDRELIVLSVSLARSREVEKACVSLPIEKLLAVLEHSGIDDPSALGELTGTARTIATIMEPRRSYLAALSTLGRSIPREAATKFLQALGCHLTLEEVVSEHVGSLTESGVELDQSLLPALRHELAGATRTALARTALEACSDSLPSDIRISLLVFAGEEGRAAVSAERLLPSQRETWDFSTIPEELFEFSEELRWRRFVERYRSGRYRDAAVDASAMKTRKVEAEAMLERRLGKYSAALARLTSSTGNPVRLTLRGELERLTGDSAASRKTLQQALSSATSEFDRANALFALALLEIDTGRPAETDGLDDYQRARVSAYGALGALDFESARRESARAIELSRCTIEKIDSSLDLLYALFLEGNWEEARHHARATLALVEETDGDRAIAGVLLTLGYLCADSGQFDDASSMAERLRKHFAGAEDFKRLREVDLLHAQIALGRCEFLEATRRAASLDSSEVETEIREAAAIVLDEAAWCQGERSALRSQGNASCRELAERHRLLKSRQGSPGERSDHFLSQLALFETSTRAGVRAQPPQPRTATEELHLIRSFLGLAALNVSTFDRELLQLCETRGIVPPQRSSAAETRSAEIYLDTFVLFAQNDYPFHEPPLGVPWKIASCNRLGTWEEVGEASPLDDTLREALSLRLPTDWFRLSERTFFYLANLSLWRSNQREGLLRLIATKLEVHRLRRLLEQETPAAVAPKKTKVEGIIGESAPMQRLLEMLPRLSARDVPVCILGESGSGKERIASTIHEMSTRRSRKFTPVNCAALPEQLLESELFGHVRGAFTGADRDKQGLIEVTDGGTLFLDEVGELPLTAQAKLLRFLQEGEYRRVGDTANRTADVRIVAATNRKLESAVDDGKFREDLYYRIRGIELTVPPLRERGSDILLIARHFLERETKKHRGGPSRFTRDVELVMLSYGWPGNVRELENTVRAAHALAADLKEIDLDHLPERLRGVLVVRRATGSFFEEITRFRKDLVEKSLTEANGNQSQAAKMLGMSRQALAYQIRELGILVKARD